MHTERIYSAFREEISGILLGFIYLVAREMTTEKRKEEWLL